MAFHMTYLHALASILQSPWWLLKNVLEKTLTVVVLEVCLMKICQEYIQF